MEADDQRWMHFVIEAAYAIRRGQALPKPAKKLDGLKGLSEQQLMERLTQSPKFCLKDAEKYVERRIKRERDAAPPTARKNSKTKNRELEMELHDLETLRDGGRISYPEYHKRADPIRKKLHGLAHSDFEFTR